MSNVEVVIEGVGKVSVPKGYDWIARDHDGSWWAYRDRPRANPDEGHWDTPSLEPVMLTDGDTMVPDWLETLRRVGADEVCPGCQGNGQTPEAGVAFGAPMICPDCAGSGRAEDSITASKGNTPIEVLRDAGRNAVIALRNCVNARQIGEGYRQIADDLDNAIAEYALASLSAPKRQQGNTPIGELLAQYEEEGCDHSNMEWVRAAAQRYVETMEDSQVRCLLHVLSAPKPESAEAVAWVRPSALAAMNRCRNDDVNGCVDVWIRPDGEHTIPLYTAPPRPEASAPVTALPPSAITWHPIETAPKDNKHPLYLAQFNPDTGELIELDWDASWEAESESWEIPQVYYVWRSANDRVEEPTHWAYQNIPAQQPAAVDGAMERVRRGPARLWKADLVGGQISVERMREILTVALAGQLHGGRDDG